MREGSGDGNADAGAPAVFVSYASQDAALANVIVETLEKARLRCWIAPRDVVPGSLYADGIVRAIGAARAFVLVLSEHAIASPHVGKEIERASSKRRPIIAIRIDSAPLTPAFEYFLSESQWIDLPREGLAARAAELVDAVRHHADPDRTADSAAGRGMPVRRPVTALRPSWLLAAVLAIALLVGSYFLAMKFRLLEPGATTPATVAATTTASNKSIAVLPFENLTGRPEDAYLADGLQEEILNALARIRDLSVISRTSVAEFRGASRNVREIGRRLGVGTILEGSIRRDGNTLRLTLQLVDARDDHHVLAANYDRDVAHVLGLQSAVARQVATALTATLGSYERGELQRVGTNSGDAYDRYLRAVALFRQPVPDDEEGLTEPKRLLEEAIALDPDYSDALALLSQAHTWSFLKEGRAADGQLARQSFERALAIDPRLPEAQLARGLYQMYVVKDLDRALADLDAVVRLRPSAAAAHCALGLAFRRRGRFAEALEHLTRAWQLDPLNHAYATAPVTTLLGLRRFPEAIEQTKLIVRAFPSEPIGFYLRAIIESYLQQSAEPLRAFLRDHRTDMSDPTDPPTVEAEIATAEGRFRDAIRLWKGIPSSDPVARADLLGFLYYAAGDGTAAIQAFRSVERQARERRAGGRADADTAARLALAQSMLGEHDAAIATVNAARADAPESRDATNGPGVSLLRSIILVRAGRTAEGYAEIERLMHVPFGAPPLSVDDFPALLLLKTDPHYDALINHPPRL